MQPPNAGGAGVFRKELVSASTSTTLGLLGTPFGCFMPCFPCQNRSTIGITCVQLGLARAAIKDLHLLGREPAHVITWKALSTTFPKPLWIPGGYGMLGPLMPEAVEHRYSPRKTSHKDSTVEYFCER